MTDPSSDQPSAPNNRYKRRKEEFMTTRLRETTTTQTPLEDAFAYTADFANIEDWDPGVAASAQVGNEPIGVGTAFDVLVAYGSRRIPMVYTITEYDRPHRVVLVGEGSTLTAVDTIEFGANGKGTEITYTADLTFKGIARFFTPFISSKLDEVGRKAVAGLKKALHERQPANDS
jgi:hypothetical protein